MSGQERVLRNGPRRGRRNSGKAACGERNRLQPHTLGDFADTGEGTAGEEECGQIDR